MVKVAKVKIKVNNLLLPIVTLFLLQVAYLQQFHAFRVLVKYFQVGFIPVKDCVHDTLAHGPTFDEISQTISS